MKHFYLFLFLILAISFSELKADVLYVKPGTTSTAWQNQSNVYSDLQTALAAAVAGDEVWVAAGIYKPTTDGDRNIGFDLKDGVHYYGGFAGNETELPQRDWHLNETILSGDIGVEGDNSDNSYHVVNLSGSVDAPITEATIIDGMIIEKGYTTYSADIQDGGGMVLLMASPIVRNVWFRNNYAADDGGALYGTSDSHAKFGNVLFTDNESGDDGGAAYVSGHVDFYNCVWYGNYSGYWGGAVYGNSSWVSVKNSVAWRNTAERSYNDFSSSIGVTNSIYRNAPDTNENINEVPGFVAADQYDFRLREGSPAIDAGNTDDVPEWLIEDFFSQARVQNEIVNIGISEGFVVTPILLSPTDSTYLESNHTDVLLEWGWSDGQPVDIEDCILEYKVNEEEPVFVESLKNYSSYTLSGINPASIVKWRVARVDASGIFNWSKLYMFVVLRGHPLHVTVDGSGSGSSWSDAMNFQAAMDVSMTGDSIWMAKGIYQPTNTTRRYESFELRNQAKIFGGFEGSEIKFSERNWIANETVLSGNIGDVALKSDNSYVVMRIMGTKEEPLSESTILDGLIIEAGYGGYNGSGMNLSNASILIRNSWFRDNFSYSSGGAVYFGSDSNPKFGNVLFTNNYSENVGGAVYSYGQDAEFYNCTWYGNSAEDNGGSMYGSGTVTNSISWGNHSGAYDNEFSNNNGVRNSIYETRDEINGNVSVDPMFVAPDKNDFRLLAGSPGINTGVNDDVPGWLVTDRFGTDRIQESVVDVGMSEGGVVAPVLLSPERKTYFESETSSVLLEWGWPNTQPLNVESYSVEFSFNGAEPVLMGNIQGLSYTLAGLNPGTVVAWRVCSVDASGRKTWSEQHHFSILRGHPLFVTPDGTGEGTSWTDAMNLQEALGNAVDGDSIWVASGIYKPTETIDREISFVLTESIKMFGGFAGTETEFSERNHIKNKTILSGDIGVEEVITDNSYHVLSAVGVTKERDDWSAVVDGFTIEDGCADGSGENRNGGGLYLEWASPLFVNVHFRNNYALYDGGAVYDAVGSRAEFGNVIFTHNTCDSEGGAVYAKKLLRFYNCVWFKNSSGTDGGAAYGRNGVVNSIFWENSSQNNYNNDLSRSELVSYTIYESGNSNNNLTGNPEFIDADNGDFRVREESIALNAGSNDALPEWLTTDYFGNSRILADTLDIGISEGAVVGPIIINPENQSVLQIEDGATVVLNWGMEDSEVAATISDYQLEYVVGSDTTLVENIEGSDYVLSGLSPLDAVKWRVGYVDGSGNTNWSAYGSFSIYRGHPLFVIPDGTGEGASWENGIDLKDALSIAVSGDSLWISAGIYKPAVTTSRDSSFVIDTNVKLFGGFSGVETFFEERNTYKNQVVLSGDIGEPGVESDNSYHVVRIAGSKDQPVTGQMLMDGVTIENGFADVYGDNDGGGLIINRASPIIKNVWFRNNFASDDGGAVYVDNLSNPLFGNVLFWKNESGDDGGAVYSGAQVNFYNCVWLGNYSGYYGGAVYDNSTSSLVYNCIAWDNEARWSYDNFHYGVSSFYSIFNNAAEENGNLSKNPGFVSVEKEDFRIKEGSPAINSGNTDYLPDWLISDFYGDNRVLEDTLDIGIAEGGVVAPTLLSPSPDSVYHISSDEAVSFEWFVEDASVLEDISAFQLEYIVNSDTILIDGITGQQYEISGFQPTDSVNWSVSYTDEQEFTIWSAQSSFFIGRGHPVFVTPDGTGDGSSWATATNLQNALDISVPGDSIWVAAGTYKPTDTDDRDISFEIKENVKLFGGFAGTETTFAQRNLVENQTILSGDIGEEGVDTDNSYHVVQVIGSETAPITLKTVIDGLIIEKGYADEDYMNGGGLLLQWASPVFRNVWFRDNFAIMDGGAVYGDNESQARYGNVIFTNNESGDDGGAVYGIGMMQFYNCVWYGNISGDFGGAVYSDNAIVNNSVAWENSADWSYNDFTYWVDVTNSIFSQGYSGDNNISQNPDFVDPSNNDFRLKEGSPAINAGSTESIPDWLSGDYYGNSRVDGDIVDMGAIEGYVITPVLVSPAEESWLEADVISTTLEWGWNDSIPNNVNGFVVEYVINDGEPQLIENLTALETALTGFQPIDEVSWRVGSLENTGFTNWSESRTFTVNRDHPLYVKPGATGNGTSWLDAMDLKDAMEISIKNDEIWIAAGTYKPTDDGDRNATFELKNGMKLYGGFGGFESSLEERDWMANETILSGDIGVEGDMNDNSYNVLRIRGTEDRLFENNVVDGFIIEGGKAQYDGGGLYIRWSSPDLRNIWLRDNQADRWGGAVYSQNGSNPSFSNVLFVNNSAASAGAAVMASSDATFNNCLWYGNTTTDIGGAIYKNNWVSVKVNNSIAWNNHASSDSDFNFSTGIGNSVFADADGSNGNIAKDPLFVDAENDIFHLQDGSPAVNAGDNDLVADELLTDFAGFDRVFGDNVDMGPFEYLQIQPVAPANGGSGTKEYSMLMMLNLVWGISDGTIEPQINIPSDVEYQMKLWKVGDEDNLLEDGPFSAYSGIDGTNNSTVIGGLEYGSAYQWTIGLDYGDYVNWSEPSTFYIGHDYTIKVKEGSAGTTGASWDDAFGTLHEALDFALPGDEIWVAEGTYYPVAPADPNNVTQAEREQALSLKPGMIIYGGLAGDESNAWNRNHVEHPVILSGDIGVADDDSDNSIHLFRNEFDAATPLGQGAVIEGFIFEDATGSAIYNVNASPSIEFSVFRNNRGEDGGAVYNDGSSPRFFNVLFHDNEASGSGGAIFADGDSKPELLSCTVAHNRASNTGGLYGTFDVKNSIVYSNENGAFSDAASQVIYSCVEGGYEGEENISYNPMWTNPENRDYSLQLFSPCIEQGNNKWFTGLFGYDLAKNSRTHWLNTDMGAFEATENGKLEVVESSVDTDGLTDFIDSITIRFNQPIAIDPSVSPVFNPDVETELKVSTQDPSLLIITHPGLRASTDYHLELPGGQVTLANNDQIIQWFVEYDFSTRACIPVVLSVEDPDVSVCPRASVTLGVNVEGDALDYSWVFNDQEAVVSDSDSLFIEAVMPENTGSYTVSVNDWCGSSEEVTLNLQYKAGTELVIPEPKWNTVYFVDNSSGNLSEFRWYLNGEEVSQKQYVDVKSMSRGDLTVTAFDEMSQCLIFGEVYSTKSASLKSAVVSPNPVVAGNPVDVILPVVSAMSRIRLYDMKGSLLIDREYGESSILQLKDTDLSSGVYLMQIEYNDGFMENKKLIIE